MRRGQGRRMRGEDMTPGGFPGGGMGSGGRVMRRRTPVDQATRVKQIAERRGITTEQASELFKQRQEKRQTERRDARKAARTERRVEKVSERRGVSKEDAQKLIADRAARRQERRTVRADRVADGTAGNGVSRQERIAGRKKEILARMREKMGMDEGKRADFQERVRGGRSGMGGANRGGGSNNRNESGQGGRLKMVRGGTPGFYDRNFQVRPY